MKFLWENDLGSGERQQADVDLDEVQASLEERLVVQAEARLVTSG